LTAQLCHVLDDKAIKMASQRQLTITTESIDKLNVINLASKYYLIFFSNLACIVVLEISE